MKEPKFFPLAFFVLAIVICFAFWPCFSAGFLNWDDPDHLLNNPFLPLRSLYDIGVLFSSPNNVSPRNLEFIPLTILSFGIEQTFLGLNPFVFHLNNILLHIFSASLVLILGCRMGISRKGAFVAALIFALHPMRVESVAWVAERKDVLFGVFYLGALVLYWDYIKSAQGIKYILALSCGVASILAKPMALSLPLVLFLFDWFAHRRWTKNSFLDKLPFILTLWPIAALTVILHERAILWKPCESLLLGAFSSTFYITKFFLPFDLSSVYLIPQPITILESHYLGSILILTTVCLSVYLFRRNTWVVFAFLFYTLTIFFLWRVDSFENIIVAERFMYIPSIGFSLLAGASLDAWFFTKNATPWKGWILASLLCAFLAGTSFGQCFVWQDSFVFWNEVLRKNPNNFKALYNRAECLLNDKEIARRYALGDASRNQMAAEDLHRAIKIKDNDPAAWHNYACALKRLGYIKEADIAFKNSRILQKK